MTIADTSIRSGRRNDVWLLATVSAVTSLIMLDSNIVAVALPVIGRSLSASFSDLQWVIGAYVLSYTSLLMASGSFADLFGRRLAMVLGLAIFAASSFACGFASSAVMLNASRAAQGVGGALLLTASLAILGHRFSGGDRTRAFAFWGASIGIAMAVGPIVGGIMTDYFGWRSVFLVNVPVCVILIAATYVTVDESSDPGASRIDWAGVSSFTTALVLLIWALIDGNDAGWTSAGIVGRLIGAGLLFGVFIFAERKQRRPMVDFSLFGRSTFLGSVFAMVGYGSSAQVMIFFLPSYLENAYQFAPMTAGLAMIPFALPMVLAPKYGTRLAVRFSGRALLTSGLIIVCLGNLAASAVAMSGGGFVPFAGAMLVLGCGAGLLNGLTVKVLQSSVPQERAGMASGLASTTRYMGILVSVAALGAVLADVTRSRFIAALAGAGVSPDAAGVAARKLASGNLGEAIAGLPPGSQYLREAGLEAFAAGFSATCVLAALLAAVAAWLAWRFILFDDTAPAAQKPAYPCKRVDCRDPV